jgi:hypothetical protein
MNHKMYTTITISLNSPISAGIVSEKSVTNDYA